MGTRGAYGFKLDGKYWVTYNHFDSYPKGLGAEVVKFCYEMNDKNGWDALKEKVRNVKLVDEDVPPTPEEIELYREFSDLHVSNQTLTDWYCLLRDLQFGGYLWGIESGRVTHMIDSFSFMSDSLFCEWGYIINLDDMTLDLYEGFQEKASDNGLPFSMKADESGYYPVSLRVKFFLTGLPGNWLKSKHVELLDN